MHDLADIDDLQYGELMRWFGELIRQGSPEDPAERDAYHALRLALITRLQYLEFLKVRRYNDSRSEALALKYGLGPPNPDDDPRRHLARK